MAGIERQTGGGPDRLQAVRQPGWVVLVGVLATACLVIGLLMLAMLQAPAPRRSVIVTSCAFLAAGILLMLVAWFSRRGGSEERQGLMASVNLTEDTERQLDELSRRTGESRDELIKSAIAHLAVELADEENDDFQHWRQAMRRVEGMWADRDDLPDFEEIRRSMDRDVWER